MGSRVGGAEAEQQVSEPGKQSEQEQGEGTHPSSTTRSIARYLKEDLIIRIIIRVHVAIVESIVCTASYWIGMAHHLLIHTASALHSLSLHTWSSFLCIQIVSGLVFVVRRGFIGASLLLAWSPVLVRETSRSRAAAHLCPLGSFTVSCVGLCNKVAPRLWNLNLLPGANPNEGGWVGQNVHSAGVRSRCEAELEVDTVKPQRVPRELAMHRYQAPRRQSPDSQQHFGAQIEPRA